MKTSLIRHVVLAFILLLSFNSARAGEVISPDRAFRFGAQYHLLTYPQGIGNDGSGVGFQGVYEFVVRPKFRVDILMAYRWFPGGVSLNQLGYGLFLRHYLSANPQEQSGIHPYLGYGLLLQVSTIGGRTGTATSHDTGLLAGTDFFVGKQRAYVEAGFHISHAAFFENATIVLSRYEVSTGVIFEW